MQIVKQVNSIKDMKRYTLLFCIALIAIMSGACSHSGGRLVDYVNPFVGTDAHAKESALYFLT